MKYVVFVLLALASAVDSAAQEVEALLHDLRKAESDSLRIAAWQALVKHYRYTNMDSALLYAAAGMAYAREQKYRLGEATMLSAMAEVNERHGLLDRAKKQYSQAQEIFKHSGYTKGVAATSNGLGVVAGRTGQYDEATRHFLKALKLYEQIGQTDGITQTYIKLGVVSDELGDLDKALAYYLKAEELNTASMSLNARLTLLNNIGIVYGKRRDIPTALQYFHQGLRESDDEKSVAIRIALLGSLGIAHEISGNRDSAYYFQEQALSLATAHNLPEEEARALVNMASLVSTNDPTRSLQLLQKALTITQRVQQLKLMTEVYEAMIALHKQQNNYKQALVLSEKRQLLKDSLFSLEKSKEIARLHANQELADQQNEIKSLALRNEKSMIQRNIMIVVALIALVLIAIVWYYSRQISALNTRLMTKQHQLSNSNTVKDKLFSVLGHDLRAPLGRIIGLLHVLGLRQTAEDESRMIETLRQQSVSTLETLDNLLLWGQSQLKGIRLDQQAVPVKAQLEKSIFLTADYAAQKNIRVTETAPPDLLAFVDPTHFDFVVRNLLSNAIKFSHSGGSIVINAVTAPDKRVVLSIHDAGIGIPKELQDEIFTSSTESARGTWNEKGTGLALMLCREYITENGGTLWVESEAGKGATFYVSLLPGAGEAASSEYHTATPAELTDETATGWSPSNSRSLR